MNVERRWRRPMKGRSLRWLGRCYPRIFDAISYLRGRLGVVSLSYFDLRDAGKGGIQVSAAGEKVTTSHVGTL